MKLSAPVHHLKPKARLLSRDENIPLHAALDRIAAGEGFGTWSLLATKLSATTFIGTLFAGLAPGNLVLIGARPRQGKTAMSLELAITAMKAGRKSAFFTLEYTRKDVVEQFHALGADPDRFGPLFAFHDSDAISAGYIMKTLVSAPRGTLVVIDYLQVLDQRRENPELADQVRELRAFALDKGLILVFISQIDRSYDPSIKPYPDSSDIRLPNPLDISLFDRMYFLNKGEIHVQAAR